MRRLLTICSLILLLLGCKERIRFEIEEGESKYFIDGYLSDEMKSHEFAVYRTIPLELEQYQPETDAAAILVIDETDEVQLTGGPDGIYCTPVMAAEEGKSYRLRIVVDGAVIESKSQRLPETNPSFEMGLGYRTATKDFIQPSGAVRIEKGVMFTTEVEKLDEPVYYQWILREHFVLDAELNESGPNKYCWITNYPIRKTFIHEDIPLDGVTTYTRDLEYLGFSRKFQVDFALEVKRLVMDFEAYNFFELIRVQATNSGGLFDAAAFSIPGNYNIDIDDQDVLGYFGVYRAQTDYVFVSQYELPYSLEQNKACFGPFARLDGPREYCYSCYDAPLGYYSLRGTKPDWWR